MRALLFDLDGVLYQSDRVIDGAVETLQWCDNRDIPHLFVFTNIDVAHIHLVRSFVT